MADMTAKDMDAVEKAFERDEDEARFERFLDRVWNAGLILGALALLSLAWWGTR